VARDHKKRARGEKEDVEKEEANEKEIGLLNCS
jgi:hypothetical protein